MPKYFAYLKAEPTFFDVGFSEFNCGVFGIIVADGDEGAKELEEILDAKAKRLSSDYYVALVIDDSSEQFQVDAIELKRLKNRVENSPKSDRLEMADFLQVLIDTSVVDASSESTSNAQDLRRPAGKRPKRVTQNEHPEWWEWEEAIYQMAEGYDYGSGKCWEKHRRALMEAGVDSKQEFIRLFDRKRDENRRKK